MWEWIWLESFYKWVIRDRVVTQTTNLGVSILKDSPKDSKNILPREEDPVKAESAKIFYEVWQLAKFDLEYLRLTDCHRKQYGV